MERSQTLKVSGELVAVRLAVAEFLSTHPRRDGAPEWVESERRLIVGLRSPVVTGGEVIEIASGSTSDGRTQLDVTSRSLPLWDWRANTRNLTALATHLSETGFHIEAGPITTRYKMGWPEPDEPTL